MVWFRWGCTASCGWHVRCVGVRGDAWSVLLSPCNTVVVVLRNHRRSRWRFPSRHPLLDLESMKYTQGVLTFGLVFCSTTEEADVLSVARTEHVRVRYVL